MSKWHTLCPLMYFVTECSTISASCFNGVCIYGDRNVLSTTSNAPLLCAVSATALISTSDSVGLLGVSIHTRLVVSPQLYRRVASSPSMSFTKVTLHWNDGATCVKYLCVPPYRLAMQMMWELGARPCTMAPVAAIPDEKARACAASSSSAMHVSKLARLGLAEREYTYGSLGQATRSWENVVERDICIFSDHPGSRCGMDVLVQREHPWWCLGASQNALRGFQTRSFLN